jgi:hypothetical protein
MVNPAVRRQPKAALAIIGLAAAARLVRNHRTRENVIMLVILLAVAVSLARDGQARSLARLAAWDRRRAQAGQRRPERTAS